ncbi:unnamed protein product [Clonostachys chloroleuca]|uniref:Uncharacterized protein n=1 Tax=Clonostachys chloroleuca TaxID=1926264 RepID=A0AA35PWT5_9HYPO|nr:unnamed protein product [Clonostachys chloroleuca]
MSSDSPFEGHKSQPDAANSMGWPTITTIIILVVGLLFLTLFPEETVTCNTACPKMFPHSTDPPPRGEKKNSCTSRAIPAQDNLQSASNSPPYAPSVDAAPQQFFPEDVPKTRILVYEYEPAITHRDNKISITGLAKGLLESCKAFCEATQVPSESFPAITLPVLKFKNNPPAD